jgi:hypothetical protein
MTTEPQDGGTLYPDLSARHPGTRHLIRFFTYSHLPEPLQQVSAECADLAEWMIKTLPDGPELTTGLRKLLEAKDAFVRAALDLPGYGD